MVATAPIDYQVSPVNARDPADQVDRREQLDQAHDHLGLVDVRVTEAGAEHRARPRQQNVKTEADVCPDVADLGHGSDELPDTHVDIADREQARFELLSVESRLCCTLWR